MWDIFKNNKEFLFKYRYASLYQNTIIFAKNREKAIKKFKKEVIYSEIISIEQKSL